MAHIGIAGAGVLGRLLAWQLAQAGHQVGVFDPAPNEQARTDGRGAAGFTAAGMLSPLAELENGGPEVARLGWRSLALWRGITARLAEAGGAAPWFQQRGSLLVAHGSDLGTAERVLARLQDPRAADAPAPQALTHETLAEIEPSLAPQLRAWLLPGEGQLLPPQLLPALCQAASRVQWHWGRCADAVQPGRITLAGGRALNFDLAIDTRGLGGRPELPVRGVRGEVVHLHAPGVPLQRPVRLIHTRHRVYLVPRPGDVIVLGASELESDDRSPVSLRSAVELMAAAHSVIPELAEARIVHLETNLRPALPDNQPHTHIEPGLLRINGLFRHGWLLAPALVEDALATLGLGVLAPTPAAQHA